MPPEAKNCAICSWPASATAAAPAGARPGTRVRNVCGFFASGGATVIDPDGAGPLFETPLSVPPWEDLAYIP